MMTSFSRRTALQSLASGFGYLAFSGLAHESSAREQEGAFDLSPKTPHFPARAKRVIFLCMEGGPSHVDLFDYKPALATRNGESLHSKQDGGLRLLGSPFRFQQQGESGNWFSELTPHLAKHADDLCFIHSMHTDLPNHSQAFLQLHTGSFQFTRPSLGAWTLYGLGTLNNNLPGFVTINPPSGNGGAKNYGSAFMPSICQGTKIGTNQIPDFYAKFMGIDKEPGPPLKWVGNSFQTRQRQRQQLDLIRDLNTSKLRRDSQHQEIEGAINSFELAFRMQGELPELLDLSDETSDMLQQYGIGNGQPTDRFGRQCLLARRLAEAGVRFIEITAPTSWDHHFNLRQVLGESCLATDQPIAALLQDLKGRGMLQDTLVVWAGEFGRTPYAQSGSGRDHNNLGYTIWMAGGGVKGGFKYGATDEIGHKAVENKCHLHDLHATLLHLLGFDHRKLTYSHAGRSFRLTNVFGNVVEEILS
ncbi:DUF1501 domain-containing protein [Aureliella helgolandensis]|uniref:Sulfatase n=1 Tax=Aureliella helgolandensis TaxID=2527968 RepID=A0A518GCT7_9BACT|nr:DUF1501 domain-containing protein [Aureliella helgolandensis]QDV26412.1 hypothetical protein Q31a_47860 [Aureliella helgolandensis]